MTGPPTSVPDRLDHRRGERPVAGTIGRGAAGEQLVLEPPERLARFDADLLDQHGAGVGVGAQRFSGPAGTGERDHAELPQPLAERVCREQQLQLGDGGVEVAGVDPRLDVVLGHPGAELVQPHLLRRARGRGRQLGRPSEQVERVGQRVRSRASTWPSASTGVRRAPTARTRRRRARRWRPGRSRQDRRRCPARARPPPPGHRRKPRQQPLDRLGRGGWWLVPEPRRERVERQGPRVLQRQHRQQLPSLPGGDRHHAAVIGGQRDRSEHGEPHAHATLLTSPR